MAATGTGPSIRGSLNLDPFAGIYGLPPSTWVSDEMIRNSMPVMEIIPSKPQFDRGLSLFNVVPDTDTFERILRRHGYSTPMPIKAAFLADNFPTDTFTNDYGETFLQKFTDVASQGMAQLAQMTGSKTGTEALQKMGRAAKEAGQKVEGFTGTVFKGAGGAVESFGQGIEQMAENLTTGRSAIGQIAGGGVNIVNRLLAGHRVDFPQVWRNSGYTPSYTATIRLYNPKPGSQTATNKYIVGPIAVFLCLAAPRTLDGRTYSWPFFHKIKATGIYNLDPAVITNIAVIKGGDQQQISYRQSLAMVDIRIDFTSLYNSLLIEEGDVAISNRPTMRSYLRALKSRDRSQYSTRSEFRALTRAQAGVTPRSEDPITALNIDQEIKLEKNEAARRRRHPTVEEIQASTRVSSTETQTEDDLVTAGPPGFTS